MDWQRTRKKHIRNLLRSAGLGIRATVDWHFWFLSLFRVTVFGFHNFSELRFCAGPSANAIRKEMKNDKVMENIHIAQVLCCDEGTAKTYLVIYKNNDNNKTK